MLFRGNREADIRRNLVKRGLIKGVIGLPANLFYGTGIPACIVVIDKENAVGRRGIFMIDASVSGFPGTGPPGVRRGTRGGLRGPSWNAGGRSGGAQDSTDAVCRIS